MLTPDLKPPWRKMMLHLMTAVALVCVVGIPVASGQGAAEPAPADVIAKAEKDLKRLQDGLRISVKDLTAGQWAERLRTIEFQIRLVADAYRGDRGARLTLNALVRQESVTEMLGELLKAGNPAAKELDAYDAVFRDAKSNVRTGFPSIRLGLRGSRAYWIRSASQIQSTETNDKDRKDLLSAMESVYEAAIDLADTRNDLANPLLPTPWTGVDVITRDADYRELLQRNPRLAFLDAEWQVASRISEIKRPRFGNDAVQLFGSAELPTKTAVFLREHVVLIDLKKQIVSVDPAPQLAEQIGHQEQLRALDHLLSTERILGSLIKAIILLDRVSVPDLTEDELESVLSQLQALEVFRRLVEPKRAEIRGMLLEDPLDRNEFSEAFAQFSSLDVTALSDEEWRMVEYSVDSLNRQRETRRSAKRIPKPR